MECKVSTKVYSEVSGSKESMMYLLPTAANKPPTGKAIRGSTSFTAIKKLTLPIKKDDWLRERLAP